MMDTDKLVGQLAEAEPAKLFSNRRVGLEKESLRVTADSTLAKTPHPKALGSALTHPHITMDFSEALLEFITPPLADNRAASDFMADTHALVARHLNNEILWAGSMPCVTKGETDIPLANFGTSNAGMMKTVYRRGIGYRYGRAMQTIAGVHYNYSFAPELWETLIDFTGGKGDTRATRDVRYMGMLRNLLRHGWIIPFLFGSSPAICKKFIDTPGFLCEFDETTLYHPHATSLRMGSIGYQNNQEVESGIRVSYDNLRDYALSLKHAIETPAERYRRIGVKEGGIYKQLNDHLLQIENELYVSARPKRGTHGAADMPLLALIRDGIEYIELRSLDVLTCSSIGTRVEQLNFIEAWLNFCLLSPSPPLSNNEAREIDLNEVMVAHKGRKPGIKLRLDGKNTPLREAGMDLCARMADVCGLLDDAHRCSDYTDTLNLHRDMFQHPDRAPSARILDEMRERHESHIEFMMRVSHLAHAEHLRHTVNPARESAFAETVVASLRKQAELEKNDTMSLDDHIKNYFAGLDTVASLIARE